MESVRALGHDVVLGTISRAADADRLHVLQRSTNPEAVTRLAMYHDAEIPWVFDIDDAIWALTPDNPGAESYWRPEVQERIAFLASAAPMVTVSTEPLAAQIRDRYRPNSPAGSVIVVPNALPDRLTRPLEGDREHLILWRGSPTHSVDIKPVRAALRSAEKKGIRTVFAGADYRKEMGLRNAEHLGWVGNTEDYIEAIRALKPTIAVIPLSYSTFNTAKSQVALLEARAVGAIPMCSDQPAYRPWITHGEDGFLMQSNEWKWKSQLDNLLSEPYSAYKSIVDAGVAWNREWSVEKLAATYEAIYAKAWERM